MTSDFSKGKGTSSVAKPSGDSDECGLAQQWESCRVVRTRLRDNNFCLVKWVKPELINKPTMAGIALNCRALTILAKWWCPQQKSPKSPSVLDLKKEAHALKSKTGFSWTWSMAMSTVDLSWEIRSPKYKYIISLAY